MNKQSNNKHILLVASSGGHLMQLYSLKKFWEKYNHTFVSFPTIDAKSLLKEETVIWASYPTNRNIPNLIKNLWLAFKTIISGKYSHVISTGAGVGVPFIWIGRIFGLKTIFIDSFTRSKGPSLSAKLVMFIANNVLTQWPEVAEKNPRFKYKGKVL